ncbi:hypothetical protein XJ28_30465 (plasmid) [Pseudomonas syringae pv. tomato]|uniref:hypothetical protein n=1 Tax=Pseudomonas syringae group TaxID=136849 RepID=UPI000CF640CB|nr:MULTISPECIES: hypothetical protein [Pseudomonas syringae group]AVI88032.1 hypothetical protein XJ28_30465 [Pseudomonas syringae pv. tomato]MDT3236820.1 hypothetical protein [Pseudomonas syringae pv. tomato]QBI65954.1 hypothetical protein EIZ61_31735 [Pseudomonas syringae]
MKLIVAQLIAVTAAIGLLIEVIRTQHLAYSEEGIFTLSLCFVLVLPGLALEIFEALREESLIQQSSFKELAL